MPFFRRNTPPPPSPAWLKIGVLLFLAAAFGSYMLNPAPVNTSLQQKNLFDYDAYRGQIIPSFGMLQATDVKEGTGSAALCGQLATIRYSETGIETPTPKEPPAGTPLTFRLGSKDAPRALSDAVLGMRAGGEREAVIPTERTEKREKPLRYRITLTSLSPALSLPADTLSLRSYDTRFGTGEELACGDTATLHLVLWSASGKKLLDTHTTAPLTLLLGDGSAPAGLAEGMRGMRVGGARSLLLPEALQAPLSQEVCATGSACLSANSPVQNAEILHKLPASAGGIALAEVELLPNPVPAATPEQKPEPQPEPKP